MKARIPSIVLLGFVAAVAGATLRAAPVATPGSWTLIHIPDTQDYSNDPLRVPIMFGQTAWIVANAVPWNIRMAVHVGDLVESNDAVQWERTRGALDQLNGHVFYAACTGNHDCGPEGNGQTRASQFPQTNRFGTGSPYAAQATFQGYFQHPGEAAGNTANAWHTFTVARQEFLVLTCEWGPRDAVVAWLESMIAARPWHRVIIVVHAYLDNSGQRYDWRLSQDLLNPHAYGIARAPGGVNDGAELWDKVVRKFENVFLVCCGHSTARAFLTSTGDKGNRVYQMLYNTQDLANGGDGWLRLLEFLPDKRTAKAHTYSSYRNEWNTSLAGEFVFHLSPVSRADADGDGMLDYFEAQHGFAMHNAADAAQDADGDGQLNAAEFLAGTDPLNHESVLRVQGCDYNAGDGTCTLKWRAVPGKLYHIQSSPALTPSSWSTTRTHRAAAEEESIDVPAPFQPRGFFRVAAVTE